MIYESVYEHSSKDCLALTLGGDHSIGIGSVAGALKAKPETAVVWVVSKVRVSLLIIEEDG